MIDWPVYIGVEGQNQAQIVLGLGPFFVIAEFNVADPVDSFKGTEKRIFDKFRNNNYHFFNPEDKTIIFFL